MPEANYDVVMRCITELNIFNSESKRIYKDCQDQLLNLLEKEMDNNDFFYSLDYYNENCEAFINRFKNDNQNSIQIDHLICILMGFYPLTKKLIEAFIQDSFYSKYDLDQYFSKYFELFKKRISISDSSKSSKTVAQKNLDKAQLDKQEEEYKKKTEEYKKKIAQKNEELKRKKQENQNYQELVNKKDSLKKEILQLSKKYNQQIMDQLNTKKNKKKHELQNLEIKDNQKYILNMIEESSPEAIFKRIKEQINKNISGGI